MLVVCEGQHIGMHVTPLSEDLFRLLPVPARVQDGATAAAVRISGDG
jgi:hypothetical protein